MQDQLYGGPDPLDLSFPINCESEVALIFLKSSQSQASSAFSTQSGECASSEKTTKDTTRNGHKKQGRKHRSRASVLAEGQQGGEKVGSETTAISCERRLPHSGCTKEIGLAEANSESSIAMERVSSYTSDEWDEESALSSDSEGNDTDSSDDDDPKSQVDRLIEKGTLMYMDGENSALSSEDESEDDTFEYDSESDITDVSPLISAAASPMGLSPVLPRRKVPTSPLALHDNSDIYLHNQNPFNWDIPTYTRKEEISTDTICDNHPPSSQDSTNMKLLLQAVIELENHNSRKKTKLNRNGLQRVTNISPVTIHPIRDNPHHTHLNKSSHKRKNMSFSNEEVNKIDRENRILLKKLISAHTRHHHNVSLHHRYHKPSNSSVNRKRDDEKIRKENLLILRKIQEAKPSKDVIERTETSSFSTSSNTQSSLRSPTSSCGASIRSLSVQTPRKETAL